MKCAKCNEEMEKGYLEANGTEWTQDRPQRKIVINYNLGWKYIFDRHATFHTPAKPNVLAFKCPKCNKVELLFSESIS